MNTTTVRRLPSADWIAFGVAVLALSMQYVHSVAVGIFSLAVFGPSLLREFGVLKDADEWTRGIMHRAGFHALLSVVGLYVLERLVSAVGLFEPAPNLTRPLNPETFRKAVIWVFLVSYLIQYWSAREGVFRILLVMALVVLAGTTTIISFQGIEESVRDLVLMGTTASVGAFVGLAFLVRLRPRTGAVLLIVLFAVVTAWFLLRMPGMPTAARWGVFQVWLQAGLVFGITGIALLRESS